MMMSQDNIFFDEVGSIWAGVEVQESWLAKLGSWSEALSAYERRLADQPDDVDAILGCIYCLDARGDWNRVLDIAEMSWSALTGNELRSETPFVLGNQRTVLQAKNYRKALKYCAQAAWRLGKWDDLEKFSSQLARGNSTDSSANKILGARALTPRVDFDGAFYSAVLNIHRQEWSKAAGT